jgi:hypothetical protein
VVAANGNGSILTTNAGVWVAALLSEAHGCSLHQLGHLTLWGVRVAFTIIR